MKRKIRIIISEENRQCVALTLRRLRLAPLIARLFFGKDTQLLLLTPGERIGGIEVCEQHCGGTEHE